MGGEGEEEEFNAEGAKITQRCGEEERGRGRGEARGRRKKGKGWRKRWKSVISMLD